MEIINFAQNECLKIKNNLDAFLSGELSESQTQEIAHHLKTCTDCNQEFKTRERIKQALRRAVQKDEVPVALQQRIHRELQKQSPDSSTPLKFPRWVLAVAATVLLGVLSVGVLQTIQAYKKSQTLAAARLQDAAVLQVGLNNHIHCAIDKDFANRYFSEAEMDTRLGEFAGLVALVKTKIPADYQILVGHRCKFNNRSFVHLILKNQDEVVSLALTQKGDEVFSANQQAIVAQISGIDLHQARLKECEVTGFASGDYLAFVVSNLEARKNLEMASSLAPVIQDFLSAIPS
ncbi:MAG: zf-HC2 domain-containing protein [Acidobacteriota bacterium]